MYLREKGTRHDLIAAVFEKGGEDDLVRLLALVSALGDFLKTDDGANLLAGYKRASNILRAEREGQNHLRRHVGRGHAGGAGGEGVVRRLETARTAAKVALAEENFAAAMMAPAGLRRRLTVSSRM